MNARQKHPQVVFGRDYKYGNYSIIIRAELLNWSQKSAGALVLEELTVWSSLIWKSKNSFTFSVFCLKLKKIITILKKPQKWSTQELFRIFWWTCEFSDWSWICTWNVWLCMITYFPSIILNYFYTYICILRHRLLLLSLLTSAQPFPVSVLTNKMMHGNNRETHFYFCARSTGVKTIIWPNYGK